MELTEYLFYVTTTKRSDPIFFLEEKLTLTQVRAIHSNTSERPKGSVRKLFLKATHTAAPLILCVRRELERGAGNTAAATRETDTRSSYTQTRAIEQATARSQRPLAFTPVVVDVVAVVVAAAVENQWASAEEAGQTERGRKRKKKEKEGTRGKQTEGVECIQSR